MSISKSSPFDNAGPAIVGIAKDFEPQTMTEAVDCAVDDQSSYDLLGPLMRKVMKESPIRWSASRLLVAARQQCRGRSITPQVDAQMAQMMQRAELGIIEKIRVSDEGVLADYDSKDAINRIVERAERRSARR